MTKVSGLKRVLYIARLFLFGGIVISLLVLLLLLGGSWVFNTESITEYPAIKIQPVGILMMLFAVGGIGLMVNIIWDGLRRRK